MMLNFLKNKKKKRKKIDKEKRENKKKLIKKLVNSKSFSTVNIKTSVKEVMSTDVKTLKPKDNIGYALELFSEYSIAGAPVIEKKKLSGLVTQKDIIKLMNKRKLFDADKDEIKVEELQKIKIKDIMNKDYLQINQNEKLTDAIEMMAKNHVDKLIVIDKKKDLKGVITLEDVMTGLSAEFFVDSIEKATDKVIESEIDKLLEIIEKRKKISIDDLVKELDLKKKHLENLSKILEKRNLVEIEYGIIGSPVVKVKS